MSLPKINDVPKHVLKIPSTNKEITFRPFLVKEQKVLLMALETQDENQIVRAVVDTIEACVYDKIEVKSLAMFDVEYIFLQIRGKSAGETAEVTLKCKKCEVDNPTTIQLDNIEVKGADRNNKFKINDNYTIQMRYPTYNSVVKKEIGKAKNLTDTVYKMLMICLDKLHTPDELINFDDYTEEQVNDFVESLNTQQFEQIMGFVNEMPTITKDVEVECAKCKEKNTYTLQGLQDFLF